MRLDELARADLEPLEERLADLRHDLGKYIRFETRFAEGGADVEALRAALRADLLSTRRRGSEVEPASAVWARLRPPELADDPDVREIDLAMSALATVDLGGTEADLRRAAALTSRVSEATRRLHARARARLGER